MESEMMQNILHGTAGIHWRCSRPVVIRELSGHLQAIGPFENIGHLHMWQKEVKTDPVFFLREIPSGLVLESPGECPSISTSRKWLQESCRVLHDYIQNEGPWWHCPIYVPWFAVNLHTNPLHPAIDLLFEQNLPSYTRLWCLRVTEELLQQWPEIASPLSRSEAFAILLLENETPEGRSYTAQVLNEGQAHFHWEQVETNKREVMEP
jgi:hypothetical protein